MHSESGQGEIDQYVRKLDIQQPDFTFSRMRSKGAITSDFVKDGNEQAFLSDKSIVSFVSSVSGQNRKDVLNSTLLAQLAANSKYTLDDNMKEWYETFIQVLGRLGWVVAGGTVDTYEADESLVEVENVIIGILTKAFGHNYIALIQSTLDALKQLSNANDGKIKVFEKNTTSLSKGCFQIALAVEENDAVSMQLGTFLLTSNSSIRKILFVKISNSATKLDYTTRLATFNSEIYGRARQAVIDKLSDDILDFVTEVQIRRLA